MKKVLHKSETRGGADYGWLNSKHTFSFAHYHDPQRMGFGALRVFNDDVVQPSMGFDTHPHNNMEIVSIPLEGTLRHKDSKGNRQVIQQGEVQVMSAGTGITHSEYNDSDQALVNFLQIWILPKERNIPPKYGQKNFLEEDRKNRFQLVVSPDGYEESIPINQDVFFSRGDLEKGQVTSYTMQRPSNGLYLFLIDGVVEVAGERLEARDGLGLSDIQTVDIQPLEASKVLLIDVPMLN